jgi:hypothetical protein
MGKRDIFIPKFKDVKDSGHREKFSTGAQRDRQAGKGMPHLLPSHALIRLSQHFENGARKYGANNWRQGIPLSSFMDSAFRHWCAIRDSKKDEDHCAALMWNAACLIETIYMIEEGKLPKELDDIGWFTNESKTEEKK